MDIGDDYFQDDDSSHSSSIHDDDIEPRSLPEFDHLAQKDIISGSVLCHLTFIFNLFIPQWFIKGPMQRVREGMLSIFKETLDIGDKAKLVYVGSFSDGINIPHYVPRWSIGRERVSCGIVIDNKCQYDIDILLLFNNIPTFDEVVINKSAHPGHFLLTDSSGRIITHAFMDTIVKRFNQQFMRSGPALTRPGAVMDLDFVPTFKCPHWPEDAIDWITRERISGWPTMSTIETIITNGCHYVAKPHAESEQPEIEWRFSFVIAEQTLLNTLSVTQKQVYVICKSLLKYMLSPGMAFSSYCLKITFFWTLEKIPQAVWNDEFIGLAVGILSVIDNLIYFLAEHCVPMYFIPENNLIEHTSSLSIRTNLAKLIRFRQDPLKTLVMFDQHNMIDYMFSSPVLDVFPEVLHEVKSKATKMISCLKLHHTEMTSYFLHSLKEHNIIGVLDISEQMQRLEMKLGYSNGFPTILHLVIQFESIEEQMIEELEGGCQSDECTGDILGCLATVMSIVYLQNHLEGTTQVKPGLVDDVFNTAMRYKMSNSSTFVYYALFLMYFERNEEAVSALEKALTFDKRQDQCILEYFTAVPKTLNPILQYIVKQHTIIRVPAFSLAYHLLVFSQYTTHPERATTILSRFHADFQQFGTMYTQWNHDFVLLGYSYLLVGDKENATRMLERDYSVDTVEEHRIIQSLIESFENVMTMSATAKVD